MNLQENYKRLFTGKARSNDASILFESPYKVKITKHEVLKDDFLTLGFANYYEGTISGPDIPKYASFIADGIAGDVDSTSLPKDGNLYTLHTYIYVPINKAGNSAVNNYLGGNRELVSIVNPNERDNKDAMERINKEYPSGTKGNDFSFHEIMTKEKKDELSKIIDDAVVKYALSKGLEYGVAEKSGGTFNFKAAMDAKKKKKKKKSKRTGPEIVVFDGEVDGRNRTASGTYGDKELEWELTTDDGMSYIFVDGKSIEDDDPMFDAILTAVDDEGYEIDLDEGYLQENYKRLFKGRFK